MITENNSTRIKEFGIKFSSHNKPILIRKFMLIFLRRNIDVTNFYFNEISSEEGEFLIFFRSDFLVLCDLLKIIYKHVDVFLEPLIIYDKSNFYSKPLMDFNKESASDLEKFIAVVKSSNRPILIRRFMLIFSKRRVRVMNYSFHTSNIEKDEGEFRILFMANKEMSLNILKQLNELNETFDADLIDSRRRVIMNKF